MLLRSPARVATAAALVAGLSLTVPAPARAADGPDCAQVAADSTGAAAVTGVNEADVALGVPEARALLRRAGRAPGAGVTVVVVDTPYRPLEAGAPSSAPSSHGLTVASIVGGPDQPDPPVSVGIAPAARLVPRPFYDTPRGESADGQVPPSAAGLAAALRGVAADVSAGRFGPRTVVLVATEVPEGPGLAAAVDAVVSAGALVIAPAGDRPGDGGGGPGTGFLAPFAASPVPGEDAGALVWPAADPDVLAVGVSLPDALDRVLRSSAVDVGAPGVGSVARGADGRWCVVAEVSTHWAAAQVAGVAALVWSQYRDDDATQLRRRLELTAAGGSGATSRSFGAGEVQAFEALQRVVPAASADGEVSDAARREVVQRALPPRAQVDRLGDARTTAVRWGIGGGALVVVLLLLRPVLARRRR